MTQKKLEGETPSGSRPAYTGKLDVAAWTKTDKNGNEYLSVKIASFVNLFEVKEAKA